MSFIPVMVIMGAYLFGSRVGMIAGCLFGLTSMMLATINAGGIPADAIFSPFNSGKPWQSLLLCYVPRIALGLIAGKGFQLVQEKKTRRWKLFCVALIALYVHALLVYIFAAAMFPEVIGWNMLLSLIFLDVNKLLELFIPCLLLLVLVRIKSKPSVLAFMARIADGYNKIVNRGKMIRYSILLIAGFLITLSGIFIEFVVFVQVIFSGNESGLAEYQQTQIDLLALQQVIGSATFVLVVLGLGVMGYCYFLSKELGDKARIQRERDQTALARKEAEAANRAKTDFLSRMSHDIRTPINGIIGTAHIMENRCDDQEQIQSGINNIKLLSHQLESLVNDVLEMSRIESGKLELAHETCHLPSVLDELSPAIQVMAESRNVVLAGSHYDLIHETVVSSPLHIQRIVSNIVSNAVKYNRPGGTVECWVEETPMDPKHSEFLFTVKDTGIGMSEDYLKKVFEPFTREQAGIDTYYSGTGLGMTITKELVDRFGGTIEIESKQDVGTTVRIMLPLELGEEMAIADGEKNNISLEGMKVLIVEDNQVNMNIAKFIIEEEKATVDTAVNGEEAVKKFAASEVGSYDLILIDLMMPVMDGLAATRAIRELDRPDAKTVPILAMTANAFEEDIRNCLAAGMDAHIAKPIDIEKMMAQVAKVFA